ncbi:MAG: PAS domain S-box protein [Nitrospinota bacterium]|nr:PAS domain S-box protein [Nitrospinota bacterium]
MLEEQKISDASPLDYRILIIDDDLDFAASLRLILENENYQPLLAHSEEEALEVIGKNAVDLALIDIRLGQDNGIELLPKLKAIQPEVLCVMVTGFGSVETAVQALNNGAYDYLRKPVNPDELLATLRRGFEKIRLIREKKTVEGALSESEQQIKASFQQAAIGIAHLSLKGTWLTYNDKFCQIIGYEREELEKVSIFDITHPEEVSNVQKMINDLLGDNVQSFSRETQFLRKDGIPVWVNVTISPVSSPSGEPLYFILFLENITKRREIEEMLQSLVKDLAEANQSLEDFTRTASHDLQEPLRKIVSFSDRLRISMGDKLDDREKEYFIRLENSSIKMQKLIEDLLRYSRISSLPPEMGLLDLREVVDEVLLDLEVNIERSKGVIEIKSLPKIEADKTQMRQLFQNLIGNALKFHNKTEPPKIEIDSRNKGNGYWEILIQDNGIGMKEEHIKRIFKPFERLHGSSEFPGTGMGLAICLKVVTRHRGKIVVKSSLGKGTLYIVDLPEHQN